MTVKDDLQHLVDRLAPVIARDPRPRATIRVGAIGHRDIEAGVYGELVKTVTAILCAIRDGAEDALRKPAVQEQFCDGLDLVVISPLAEGADRLIAQAGQDQGFALGAILPFNIPDYEASFDLGNRDAAIEEFHRLLGAAALPHGHGILVLDGESAGSELRDAAFLRCASTVTRWSDILIAILSEDRWDSQTGQIARRAIDMGVPVIVIDPKQPDRFLSRTSAENTAQVLPNDSQNLRQLAASLLAPSVEHASGNSARPGASFGLAGYRDERIECDLGRKCEFEYKGPYRAMIAAPVWARCCSGLNRWIEKRIEKLLTTPVEGGRTGPFLWDIPLDRATAAPIVELYLRHHRADVVANAYAELQRSVQIVIALLGVATVTFAALGTQTQRYSPVFAGLELACLALALSYVWVSQRQAWLDRWLDCRLLAEIFRYSKFLLMTGLTSPFADLRGFNAAGEGERTWARDQAQSVLRANRLSVPGRGRAVNADAVGMIARYIAAQCLDGQSHYHSKTGHLRLKTGEALKTLGVIASLTTIAVVGAKFGLELMLARHILAEEGSFEIWKKAAEVAGIVLPALTAGLLALRAFGEHDVVGLRSLAMMKALEQEKRIVRNVLGMQALGDEMLLVARLLLNDVAGWRELFAGKNLES